MLAPRRRTSLVVLALVGAAALAGCSDDSSSSSDDPSGGGSDSGSERDGGSGGGGGAGSDASEVAELLAKRDGAAFSVTYELAGSNVGAATGGDGETMRMTFAVDGDRTAFTMGDVRVFELPDGNVMCTSETQCMTMPDGDSSATSFRASLDQMLSSADAIAEEGSDAVQVRDREIAGRDATCFEYEWSALGSAVTATSCLDGETGVPLLTEWGAEHDGEAGAFSSTAVEFGEPTDEDFTPPAEPTDIASSLSDAAAGGGMSQADIAKLQEQLGN